eukprot:COSAG02_NODE_1029_length_15083_cov_8.066271_7_plen_143_part_00
MRSLNELDSENQHMHGHNIDTTGSRKLGIKCEARFRGVSLQGIEKKKHGGLFKKTQGGLGSQKKTECVESRGCWSTSSSVLSKVEVGVVVLEVRCAWRVVEPSHRLVPKRGPGPTEPSSGLRGRAAPVGHYRRPFASYLCTD